jgi:general stress protein 26
MLKQTMQAEEVIRRFQEQCDVAMLATVEGDKPRIRPMAPLSVEGNVIWMAAFANSEKMAQMAHNPHVELCYIDDQRRHLRVSGTAEAVDDAALKDKMWEIHPSLREYFRSPRSPQYRLIKVTVTKAMVMENVEEGYRQLQVTE